MGVFEPSPSQPGGRVLTLQFSAVPPLSTTWPCHSSLARILTSTLPDSTKFGYASRPKANRQDLLLFSLIFSLFCFLLFSLSLEDGFRESGG